MQASLESGCEQAERPFILNPLKTHSPRHRQELFCVIKTATRCVLYTLTHTKLLQRHTFFYNCIQYNHNHHIHAHSIKITLGLILVNYFTSQFKVISCHYANCASTTIKHPTSKRFSPTSKKYISIWCNTCSKTFILFWLKVAFQNVELMLSYFIIVYYPGSGYGLCVYCMN